MKNTRKNFNVTNIAIKLDDIREFPDLNETLKQEKANIDKSLINQPEKLSMVVNTIETLSKKFEKTTIEDKKEKVYRSLRKLPDEITDYSFKIPFKSPYVKKITGKNGLSFKLSGINLPKKTITRMGCV